MGLFVPTQRIIIYTHRESEKQKKLFFDLHILPWSAIALITIVMQCDLINLHYILPIAFFGN